MVDSRTLRIVFLGTPAFAVPTLDALLASRHAVVAVVTQPDRPRGRGHKTSAGPVKQRALDEAIPVIQPESLKEPAVLDQLSAVGADLGVVAAFGRILSERVLAMPRLGMINVHASLLPRYRGAAPVHRAIIAGEHETGVTIMRVVKALDAGPMLAAASRPIGDDETSEEVERALADLGAGLLVSTVDAMSTGAVSEVPQNDRDATYAHRLTRDDGLIDWTASARAIHNLVRGLYPWPHACTFVNGHRLIVLRATVAERSASSEPPGAVVEADGDRLHVAAGTGLVAVEQLQLEGRRPMNIREFLAGHRLAVGDRFSGSA